VENKLSQEDVNRIVNEAKNLHMYNPYLRLGQNMFNILNKYHPKLASEIRTTENDPYYTNNNIKNFINYISGTNNIKE
jgi:hypothetical protein